MSGWLLENTRDGQNICVEAGRIVRVFEWPDRMTRLDCAGGSVEPGWVNAHTHLYSGLVPFGMPPPSVPPEDFLQILSRIWWRLDRALDAASLYAAARYYISSALLMGTTSLVDHHESPDMISGSLEILARACGELGIRALLTYGASERNRGETEGQEGLAECRRFLTHSDWSGVRGLVGLHASFTVGDKTISDAARLCQEMNSVLHVHVAEDLSDVYDAQRRGYPGPLERLLDLQALPPGSVVAHGVYLSAEQVRACQERGLWLVQNPRSNHGNRVGYPKALSYSNRVALGTDGYPASMTDESEALRDNSQQAGENARIVAARVQAGQSLLAERFGIPFGQLTPFSAADLVVKNPAGKVHHVLVQGHLVVRNGVLLNADSDEIQYVAKKEAARLWANMAAF